MCILSILNVILVISIPFGADRVDSMHIGMQGPALFLNESAFERVN